MKQIRREELERGWHVSRDLELVPLNMTVIESDDGNYVRLEHKEDINVEQIMSRAISERLVLSDELFMKILLHVVKYRGLEFDDNVNKLYSYHTALSSTVLDEAALDDKNDEQNENIHNDILLLAIYITLKKMMISLKSVTKHEMKLMALHLEYDLSDKETESLMRSLKNYELMNVITF